MTPEYEKKELQRFNELSPIEAKLMLQEADGEEEDFRSCWYCNGAHEHLKTRVVLRCFACGVLYIKGFPGLVVFLRSEDKTISYEDLAEYWKDWAEND